MVYADAPPPGYCLAPDEELREYMRRSVYLAAGGGSLEELRGGIVASVGDYTTRRLWEAGIHPRIAVVDCVAERRRVECPEPPPGYRVVRACNPRGTISAQTWYVIAEAWESSRPTLVIVEGEEDLVAIPVIIEAPGNALVAYGVPWAGLNIVEADWAKTLAEHIARVSVLTECNNACLGGGRGDSIPARL